MAADDQPPPTGPGAEQQWLAAYDPRAYAPIAVTVDVVALTLRHGGLHVLLVERGAPPHQGCWALPGGFLRRTTPPSPRRSTPSRSSTGRCPRACADAWSGWPRTRSAGCRRASSRRACVST
ncbi:hypothetical protein ACIQOV_05460 [Kitasatospora sp. NPDC091257]|uniref:hypothetical protein n=1 Tax=Kitasatospora sp. NPDC091257 TaxID=3364084 RepID=UPI00382A061A